jgi:hypothetical protein
MFGVWCLVFGILWFKFQEKAGFRCRVSGVSRQMTEYSGFRDMEIQRSNTKLGTRNEHIAIRNADI